MLKVNGKVYSHEDLVTIGNTCADEWGAYFDSYTILEEKKIVKLHCQEQGDKVEINLGFDELEEYDYSNHFEVKRKYVEGL